MNNHERVKQRAIDKGRRDALSGNPANSRSKAGSMWDKYYWIGYDQIPVDQPAQNVQAVQPNTK